MFSKIWTKKSTNDCSGPIDTLRQVLSHADAVVIGAGAGLSTSAGFTYDGERFREYFSDFASKYGFTDMYSGGFYPYPTMEEYWAYWSRYIYINRYQDAPKPVYQGLFSLVKDKDYFVLTTNVDHCFQKVGFDKKRLFYTQGDYGLFQCSEPCCQETYDNDKLIRQMVEAQGYIIAPDGQLTVPENTILKTYIPSELVPHCPHCSRPMSMNLRADDTFVEDEGWHRAAERYREFLHGASLHPLQRYRSAARCQPSSTVRQSDTVNFCAVTRGSASSFWNWVLATTPRSSSSIRSGG